jgi:hypothetical protein
MAPTQIPTSTAPAPDVPGRGAWRLAGGLLPIKPGSASRVGYYRLSAPSETAVGAAYVRTTVPVRTYSTMAVNLGVKAIQRLCGMNEQDADGWFGAKTDAAVRAAQVAGKVAQDGIVGPGTMRALLTPVLQDQAIDFQVPLLILGGLMVLESALDPGAVGVNGVDSGLVQINRGPTAHPEVTPADAFDPAYAAAWTAEQLRGVHDQWADKTDADPWDIAIAAHNSPVLATQWARASVPPRVPGRVIQIEDYVIKVRTGW